MSHKEKKYKYIVSIDFGTTYTGFAWLFSSTDEIMVKSNWPDGIEGDVKTDSVILYSTEGSPLEFGATAKKTLQSNRNGNHFPLERYKLDLLDSASQGIQCPKLDYNHNGKIIQIDLIGAVTFVFKSIKKIFEQHFEEKSKIKVDEDSVRWVLTVPGNADDQYFRYLREAAFDAGLTNTPYSEQIDTKLVMAKEPEVAALYCYRKNIFSSLKEVNHSMVILDCGGGTVDIGGYQTKQKKPFKYDQISYSRAENCGGSFLNKNFEQSLLTYIFGALGDLEKENTDDIQSIGKAVVAKMKTEPSLSRVWLKLMQLFEHEKRNFYSSNTNGSLIESISIDWPRGIVDYYKNEIDFSQEKLKIAKLEENEVFDLTSKYDPDSWIIQKELLQRFVFDPVINETLSALQEVIKEILKRTSSSQIGTLILVGGYSNTHYLKKRIKDLFSDKFQNIVQPKSPSVAVLGGAAFFGDDPDSIRSRILSKSYGLRISLPYGDGPNDDAQSIAYSEDGTGDLQFYCTNRIDISRNKGSEFVVNERYLMGKYVPINDQVKEVDFEVYVSKHLTADYINDDGVKPLVHIKTEFSSLKAPYSLFCYHIESSMLCFEVTDKDGTILSTSDNVSCDYGFGDPTLSINEESNNESLSSPKACYLLIDTSSSMRGKRLNQAIKGAAAFTASLHERGVKVGGIAFGGNSANVIFPPDRDLKGKIVSINSLGTSGSTPMAKGFKMAAKELDNFDDSYEKSICLFTDGGPDSKEDTISAARNCVKKGITSIVCIGAFDADKEFLGKISTEGKTVIKVSGDLLTPAFIAVSKDI